MQTANARRFGSGRRASLELGARWAIYSPLEPRKSEGAQFYDPLTSAEAANAIGQRAPPLPPPSLAATASFPQAILGDGGREPGPSAMRIPHL